ncbi:glycoside hydrolase family 24 [Bradyrhizobium sp. LVM 105]|nr:glycoside hydrolase family 24 [Bradyrhizobium sp. LVM 105]
MALDQSLLDAIKGFEGYSAAPAWDYKQSSSGYGTKAQPGDENIPPDQLKAVHEQRFLEETSKAAASVDAFNPNLPPGVRAALTSLTYNAGPGWQQSGLGQAIKAGDYDKAREIFLQYNKAGGEVNPGLVARRQKEAAWFAGQPQSAQAAPAAPASGPLAQAPAPAPGKSAPSIPGGLLQPPIFPQQAPQQAAQADPGFFAQIPAEQAMQAPQIHFAQRRPVNLTGLRNALQQRAPIFAKV